MNKKGNQRYQETCLRIEKAVLNLLEIKGAEQITVSEVCREAQVHRTTFYGHYKDIPDLMNHVAGKVYEHMMEGFELSGKEKPGEGFVRLFYYIRDNQQLFRCLMDYYSARRFDFAILPPSMEQHMKKVRDKYKGADYESTFYHHIFFSEGLKAVLYRWLMRECAETPEQMWEIVSKEYNPFGRNNYS